MFEKIRLVELFSGIGSQAKSLQKVGKKLGIEVDLTATCEWDIHAFLAYYFLHIKDPLPYSLDSTPFERNQIIDFLYEKGISYNGKSLIKKNQLKRFTNQLLMSAYAAIKGTNNFVNISTLHGSDLPENIDIMTYSFPCQDLSNVGAFHGFKNGIDKNSNSRSGLLWQVERLLREIKLSNKSLPKFLVMENVASLYSPRHKPHFIEWKTVLEKLGYLNFDKLYDAQDYGIPQTRKRVIMISVLSNDEEKIKKLIDKHNLSINTPKKIKLDSIIDISNNFFNEKLEAQPNNTQSRMKIWNENNKLYSQNGSFLNAANTITTKQDRHPNSGNIYFNYEGNIKSNYRFITSRESLLLMGFDHSDYESLINNNFISFRNYKFFSRDVIYKLAGNSIVVPMLDHVFELILKVKNSLDNE
jgi:DNA (cytosine-5)-methyltransferase 1